MPTTKESRPTRKLAGKQVGRPGDENGKATRVGPRNGADDTSIRDGGDLSLDICSREAKRYQQRMDALALADDVRLERVRVRRELQAGERDFDEFLDEPPECCASVSVVKLLTWLPNIGRPKAQKIVAMLPLPELASGLDIRVGEMPATTKYALSRLVHVHVGDRIAWSS